MDVGTTLCTVAAWCVLAVMNPHAAVGAAFGCMFFLARPSAVRGYRRFLLALFSLGMGYAAAVFFYGGGPPYDSRGMLIGGAVSALVAVVWTAFHRMAEADGPLPQWAKDILALLPNVRRKGPDDGN